MFAYGEDGQRWDLSPVSKTTGHYTKKMNYPPPPRKYPLFTMLGFLFDRPTALFIGVVSGVFPLFVAIQLLPVLSTLDSDKPNFTLIDKKGIEVEGVIEKKEVVANTTINGEHPIKITYTYQDNEEQKRDSIETMSLLTVSNWKVGDRIQVKYFEGDSIIPDAEPVNFPFWVFGFIPLLFSFVGLSFLGWALAGTLKKRHLYLKGEERVGKVISMAPISGDSMFFSKSSFRIHYAFENKNGDTSYGISVSSDLALMNEKRRGDDVSLLISPVSERVNCVVDERIMCKAEGMNITRQGS
ncbi:MAG: hypothetical protein QNJ46_27485 [Leptolyngbyaceae cyanobacterium MO_188.B28]|nr:hypothetical protein [Leptolyngbyaceae cyanobacterium MO_188.B28]